MKRQKSRIYFKRVNRKHPPLNVEGKSLHLERTTNPGENGNSHFDPIEESGIHDNSRLILGASQNEYGNELRQIQEKITAGLKRKPFDSGMWLELGLILRLQGRTQEALAAVQKATEFNGENATAWREQAENLSLLSKKVEPALTEARYRKLGASKLIGEVDVSLPHGGYTQPDTVLQSLNNLSPIQDSDYQYLRPHCPVCGSPVGMKSKYCLMCGFEFDSGDATYQAIEGLQELTNSITRAYSGVEFTNTELGHQELEPFIRKLDELINVIND